MKIRLIKGLQCVVKLPLAREGNKMLVDNIFYIYRIGVKQTQRISILEYYSMN